MNWSNQDLNCFADISDPDGDDLNVSVRWYRNDSFFSAVDYNNSFENGTSFNATLDSSNTAVGDMWHCGMRLHDGELFSDWVNSTSLEVVNTPPFSVVLLYPEHEDHLFIDRSPEFNWTASYDPDGGELSYEFQINTENDFASPWKNVTGIEIDSYQWVDEDLDFNTYHWRVRAYDGIDYSEWSNVSNFTVVTFLNVSLTESNVNFGLVSPGSNASTEHEGEPSPFTFFNYGNIEADLINVSATESLFQNADLNQNNWQVRARPGSTYDESISITSWTDVSNSVSNLIRGFNRSSEVFVDTRISVPFYEPPGETTSNITFTWEVATPWCNPEYGIVIEDVDPNVCWQKTVSDTRRNHADTLTYCSNLKLEDMEDWDVPTRKELIKLRNYACSKRTTSPSCSDCNPVTATPCSAVEDVNLANFLEGAPPTGEGFTGFRNNMYMTKNSSGSFVWVVHLMTGNVATNFQNNRVVCVSRKVD